MPALLELDTSAALDRRIGPAHGLGATELRQAARALRRLLRQLEREHAAGGHAWRNLPYDKQMLGQVQAAVRRHRPGCENLVVLGIGGSALGNIALQTALNPPEYNLLPAAKRRGPRLFVLDNVDPVRFGAVLDLLGPQLKRTKFNVISKSGETAETAAQFLVVRDLLRRRLGPAALSRQIIVTTDPEQGVLRRLADEEGYDTLPVPPGVGGRFSVLSAVGLFSAAMCGIRIGRLLAGARDMLEQVRQTAAMRNPAALLALVLYLHYVRGKRLHVLFCYSEQMRGFADWYRQLWAESLGKCTTLDGRPTVVGPTPVVAIGATDQHSQVQLYREGPNDKVFIFVSPRRFARDVKIPRVRGTPAELSYLAGSSLGKLLHAEMLATQAALIDSKRPCLTLWLERIDEQAIGQYIILWEAATVIAGRLLNINPYDQPAVQLGKDYTYALMGRSGYRKLERRLKRIGAGGGNVE